MGFCWQFGPGQAIITGMKPIIRIVANLLGLAGLGTIVTAVLKKWELVGHTIPTTYIILPILCLYLCREALQARWIRESQAGTQGPARTLGRIVNFLLVLISILVCLSIPFLWFGVIEELAGSGGRL